MHSILIAVSLLSSPVTFSVAPTAAALTPQRVSVVSQGAGGHGGHGGSAHSRHGQGHGHGGSSHGGGSGSGGSGSGNCGGGTEGGGGGTFGAPELDASLSRTGLLVAVGGVLLLLGRRRERSTVTG